MGAYKRWKLDPAANHEITDVMATELVSLIQSWQPLIPMDWVVSAPPQGASIHKTKNGDYPASFLAKSVANKLGIQCELGISRAEDKRYHGRYQSMAQAPYTVSRFPKGPVLLVDDMITSGTTLRLSQAALAEGRVPSWAFAWVG